MTAEQLALVTEWHRAQASLKQWEVYERQLRGEVVAAMFGDYGDGSKSADLGNGYTLKNVNATRWDVYPSEDLAQLLRNFANYEPTSEAGKTLVKLKPTLSIRAFKSLPEWGAKLMYPHLKATPQAPQLTVTTPEKAR